MKITNPTGSDIEVQIQGNVYKVEANGELSNVPAEHAAYWKDMIHNFITVEDESAPMVAEAPAEEPKEEKKEEVVVEEPEAKKAPAKKVTSKSKK